MADVEYMHICDYAFAAQDGKACIIGIFNGLGSQRFPVVHPQMYLAVQFVGQPHANVSVRIEFARPNGDLLGVWADQVLPTGSEGRAFLNVHVVNVEFPEPGRYTVKAISADRTLKTNSIDVQLIHQGGETRH